MLGTPADRTLRYLTKVPSLSQNHQPANTNDFIHTWESSAQQISCKLSPGSVGSRYKCPHPKYFRGYPEIWKTLADTGGVFLPRLGQGWTQMLVGQLLLGPFEWQPPGSMEHFWWRHSAEHKSFNCRSWQVHSRVFLQLNHGVSAAEHCPAGTQEMSEPCTHFCFLFAGKENPNSGLRVRFDGAHRSRWRWWVSVNWWRSRHRGEKPVLLTKEKFSCCRWFLWADVLSNSQRVLPVYENVASSTNWRLSDSGRFSAHHYRCIHVSEAENNCSWNQSIRFEQIILCLKEKISEIGSLWKRWRFQEEMCLNVGPLSRCACEIKSTVWVPLSAQSLHQAAF